MAAARNPEFSKFGILVMKPVFLVMKPLSVLYRQHLRRRPIPSTAATVPNRLAARLRGVVCSHANTRSSDVNCRASRRLQSAAAQ